MELIQNSNNVETVVGRWDFFVRDFSQNIRASIGPYERIPAAAQLLSEVERLRNLLVENQEALFRKAIDRAYLAELEKAAALKTESGREKRMERFFELTAAMEKLGPAAEHVRELQLKGKAVVDKAPVSAPPPPTQDSRAQPANVHTKEEVRAADRELAQRLRQAFASNAGLYPHELLMLDYAPSYALDQDSFPGFWFYQYFVTNPKALIESLMSRGFLQQGTIEESLKNAKVTELKSALTSSGLNTSGKKEALIRRLMTECDPGELARTFPRRYYERTQKGESALADGTYVSFIHKHKIMDMDAWSLNRLMHDGNGKSHYEVIWNELERLRKKDLIAGNFGIYRCRTYEMAMLLMETQDTQAALSFLMEVVYYDLSGLGNNWNDLPLNIKKQYLFASDSAVDLIPPGVIEKIIEVLNRLSMSVDDIKIPLRNAFQNIRVPFHRFSVDECIEYTLSALMSDENKMRSIFRTAKQQFS